VTVAAECLPFRTLREPEDTVIHEAFWITVSSGNSGPGAFVPQDAGGTVGGTAGGQGGVTPIDW
jgi:hypothetical protein